MTTLIDTNVLIYLSKSDDTHHERAVNAFVKCKLQGPVLLTDMAYAEFSVGMNSKLDTDTVVEELELERVNMSDAALYEAGRAFLQYKNNGGGRNKPMPDHFIGAHAKVLGARLLTNNVADYALIEGLEVVSIDTV